MKKPKKKYVNVRSDTCPEKPILGTPEVEAPNKDLLTATPEVVDHHTVTTRNCRQTQQLRRTRCAEQKLPADLEQKSRPRRTTQTMPIYPKRHPNSVENTKEPHNRCQAVSRREPNTNQRHRKGKREPTREKIQQNLGTSSNTMSNGLNTSTDSLAALRGGRIPPPRSMPSFEEIKEILGFNTYYKEEQRYATSSNQLSSQRVSSSRYSMQNSAQDDTKQRGQSPDDPIVEVITPYVYDNNAADGSKDPFSQIWSRTLRIKITGRDGFERLDVRIPAGFLEGITNIVPALGGVNIKALLDDAADEVGGKQLLDFIDTMGDRIQVFLE